MPKITDKQRAVLTVLKDGGGIRWYCSPGADHGGYFFECKGNHRDVDGRKSDGQPYPKARETAAQLRRFNGNRGGYAIHRDI